MTSADFGYKALSSIVILLTFEYKMIDSFFDLSNVGVFVALEALVGVHFPYSSKIIIEWYMLCSYLHDETGLVTC